MTDPVWRISLNAFTLGDVTGNHRSITLETSAGHLHGLYFFVDNPHAGAVLLKGQRDLAESLQRVGICAIVLSADDLADDVTKTLEGMVAVHLLQSTGLSPVYVDGPCAASIAASLDGVLLLEERFRSPQISDVSPLRSKQSTDEFINPSPFPNSSL